MSKFEQLVAAGQAARMANPDTRTLGQKIADLAESARKHTLIASASVEDVAKRSASQYLDLRAALKADRVAKGYRW